MDTRLLFSIIRAVGTALTTAATLYYAFESSRRRRKLFK